MGDSGLWKRLFIGNLPSNFNEDDIRSLFKDYNSIQRVDVKHTYAYVYFVDSKEAFDCIDYFHGREVDGKVLKVEDSNPKKEDDRNVPPKYELRIRVHDLSPRTTWQDLKDWARNAGSVKYANVFQRGSDTMGVIEFQSPESFDSSFKILPDIMIKNERVRITKELDEKDNDKFENTRGGGGRDGFRGGAGGGYQVNRYDNRNDNRGRYDDRGRPGPGDNINRSVRGAGGGNNGGGYSSRGGYEDDYRRPPPVSNYYREERPRSRSRSREARRYPPAASNASYDRPAGPSSDFSRGGYSEDYRRPPPAASSGAGYERGGYDRGYDRSHSDWGSRR